MTYESEDLIKTMLENDGVYPGDPQMARIYVYLGRLKGQKPLYAVFSHHAHDDMHLSPYVGDYQLLWSENGGLTQDGFNWLEARR